MLQINAKEFHSKVLGCWMGKNIGGTLGAPVEWRRQVNHFTFYSQELGGEPLPNDDLDVQLLWLVALEELGIEVTAQRLAEYWTLYLTPHWSEYGIAKINMRAGLVPPMSGTMFNEYKDSCGCFLRSEIWACLAPGNPRLAVRYALQDGMIDHGDGEGTYAEIFCAALESAAFVIQDVASLIQIALTYIPENCGVAGAVREAMACYRGGKTWREARDCLLEKYRGLMFFNMRSMISDEDFERGLGTGQRGWDAPSNIGIIIIGLLYGEGDFGRSVCTAVNCGEDTDCTGATLGSLFGILHGIEGIPEEWIAPIGRNIKTACLNLGELGYYGGQIPADVDDLTRRTIQIAHQVIARYRSPVQVVERQKTNLSGLAVEQLIADADTQALFHGLSGSLHHFDFFDVWIDYGQEGPVVRSQAPKEIRLRIYNRYKVQANLKVRWYTPANWTVSPGLEGFLFSLPAHLGAQPYVEAVYRVEINLPAASLNRAVVEITIEGRSTVMLAPVMLLNGNLM